MKRARVGIGAGEGRTWIRDRDGEHRLARITARERNEVGREREHCADVPCA